MPFVFYDTETTGTDTAFDQILQFAAIRTDDELNELERFDIRCRLLDHVIPAPRALITTGVTPVMLTDPSLPSHNDAMCLVAAKLESWSPAVFIGYNSMDFDERLLRQAFYQNLKPIYLTNTNRNTRADMLKLINACIAYAPDALLLPLASNGRISRRLDAIAPANGFDHQDAHDALADVQATIYMAKLLRERTPDLWSSVMPMSSKDAAIRRILNAGPLALVECHYGRHSVLPIVGCGQNPEYGAQLGAFDLRHEPGQLFELSVEELIEVLRGKKSPIRIVQYNAQPLALPLNLFPPSTTENFPSSAEIAARARSIQTNQAFQMKVGDAIARRYPEKPISQFVEQQIYDSFPSTHDARSAAQFHRVAWDARRPFLRDIKDRRWQELGERLIAIEAPNLLDARETARFTSWLNTRRFGPAPANTFRTVAQAMAECDGCLTAATQEEHTHLMDVKSWLGSLRRLH